MQHCGLIGVPAVSLKSSAVSRARPELPAEVVRKAGGPRSRDVPDRHGNVPGPAAIRGGHRKERPMNVGDERSRSCWMDGAPTIAAAPLDGDRTCDVVVIG